MFGILLNREPMGIQSQTGEFKYLTFNTQEETQNFCNNIAKSLGYAVEVIPCRIQTQEEYEKEHFPGIEDVNTTSKFEYYQDGEQ